MSTELLEASIALPVEYDLIGIARAAGVVDTDSLYYADGVLHTLGVSQTALEAALANYSHLDYLNSKLLERIAARRYRAEVAGINVNGVHIRTDRDSGGLILGGAVEAMLNPAYILRWKTPTGFIQLDADNVIAIARAVRAHVQTCFDREEVLGDAVRNGTFQESMLEEGWPAA